MYTSVFDLAVAMNESIENSHSGGDKYVPDTVDLPVNLDEAIDYMDFVIANEAANFVIMSTNIDEIMTEAALYHNDKVVAMSEASFESVKNSVIGFFKKIIGFFSAIINRIAEFLAKFTNKTDSWVKLIKPRLDEAKKDPKFGEIKAEVHPWNKEFILKTMPTGIASMAKFQNKSVNDYVTKDNIPTYASNPDSAAFSELDKLIEKNKGNKEDDVKAVLAELKVGNATADSIDDFWKKIDESARGGDKAEITVASELDAMMKFIEGAKASIKEIEAGYEEAKATMSSRAKEWEAALNHKVNSLIESDDKEHKKYNVRYTEAVKSCANAMIVRTNVYSSIVGGLQKRAINYIKAASSEYMSAVTKAANKGKAPKGEKPAEEAPAEEA